MKKHISTIIFSLVFFIGLGVLLYPVISDYINTRSQTSAIVKYSENISGLDQEEQRRLIDEAIRYNERLSAQDLFLVRNQNMHTAYKNTLRVNDTEVIGSIEIPEIDVSLPIYHGTGQAVLQIGVGHLEGSSLPVGGESTHAVLTGHRGLPSAKLFTNLDKMAIGSTFSIQVLNQKNVYVVDRIDVVEPEEVDRLSIERGQDLVTLVTCTPYGQNTHRLLVRGHRILDKKLLTEWPKDSVSQYIFHPLLIAGMGLLIVILLLQLIGIALKRRRRAAWQSAGFRGYAIAGEVRSRHDEIQ